MADDLFDQIEDTIMKVRDAYPRRPDDAPSAEVTEAVMKVLGDHDQSVRGAERERVTAALRRKFGPTNRAADWIDRTFWEETRRG